MSDDPRALWSDVQWVEGEAVEPATLTADGFSPLHHAAMSGDVTAVWRLLARGVEVDTRSAHPAVLGGLTALHAAVAAGHAPIVELLLRAGASVEARDAAGYTPLALAAQLGHGPIVKRLLTAGARPCAEVGESSPLGLARRAGHAQVAALLQQVCGTRSR